MSDTSTQADQGQEASGENPHIQHLREKAGRADEAQAALAQLARENAMLQSGIDLESPLGKFFVDSYNGDPSDVEALKAKASELGVPIKGQAPVTEAQVVEERIEPTGTAQRMALSDGAPADTGEDKDPRQLSREQFDRRMAEGATREDASAEHLNLLANAAARGDKRVIVK